jgi:DNA-binding NtrC family response regulator
LGENATCGYGGTLISFDFSMETILLVEDDPLAARSLSSILAEDYRILHCPELKRAPEATRRSSPAAVVLSFPVLCGARDELIRRTSVECGGAPLVVLSSEAQPSDVVECLRSGAFDFLAKPCSIEELRRSLNSALTSARIREDLPDGPFIGSSSAIKAVENLARLYADSPYPVLIMGESGTGKEIAARALRDFSAKRTGPFVARNCAAVPELLIESELFGTERGAFTDAVSRPGAFELARGGVLFLDEIGEASLSFQAKLLRVLESGEYWRLGGRANLAADFRFVSATCRDLPAAAKEGRFRSDLLYRINTLIIEIPPLRARCDDIADLATHFALIASHGRVSIGTDAMDRLMAYDWPGNTRELRNIIHRALVLAGRADELQAKHIVF